jgi:hypothetical protein
MQPLLLVCEDLHWLDTETQAPLESRKSRLLGMVNARKEKASGSNKGMDSLSLA